VLEGSVRRDGERVRVSTQLVEANTGNHIWAERFDRAVTDIFAVQDEIADAAAQAIVPQISHAEQQRILRRPRAWRAWEASQRGLWHMDKANAADNALACEFFRQAIELGGLYRTTPMNDAIDLAMRCAEAALVIDAHDPVVHAAMGWVLLMSGHVGAAAVRIEQALSIDPNDARARRFKGALLIFDGHPAEGRAFAPWRITRRSAQPGSRDGSHDNFEGDYAAAADAAERCITAHPGID
jgi:adenylate cyclase